MNNKNLIIGGVILAGLVAYYFYNKNKGGGLLSRSSSSAPANQSSPTMGENLTDCKNIVTIPCLVAPCPQRCADNVKLPKKDGSPAVARANNMPRIKTDIPLEFECNRRLGEAKKQKVVRTAGWELEFLKNCLSKR